VKIDELARGVFVMWD